METLKTQVSISDDRRLLIDLKIPDNISTGKMDVVLVFQKKEENPAETTRVLGTYKGKIRIAEDFDKDLGDAFWQGENDELSA